MTGVAGDRPMQAIRNLSLSGITVALLLLSLLALDDITTGREPSFVGEWTMVTVLALWVTGLSWWRLTVVTSSPG